MGPGGINEYLAAAHRQDLLREAERARLATEVTAAAASTVGMWSALLLRVADVLLNAGYRLRARAIHERPAYTSQPALRVASMHHHHAHHHDHPHHDQGEALQRRIVWLDV